MSDWAITYSKDEATERHVAADVSQAPVCTVDAVVEVAGAVQVEVCKAANGTVAKAATCIGQLAGG